MFRRIVTRLASMLLTLFLASIVIFVVIQLPPGDYAEQYAYHMQESGVILSEADIQELRAYYGLDRYRLPRKLWYLFRIQPARA
jgi:peptide/nickel transport system permease protein